MFAFYLVTAKIEMMMQNVCTTYKGVSIAEKLSFNFCTISWHDLYIWKMLPGVLRSAVVLERSLLELFGLKII